MDIENTEIGIFTICSPKKSGKKKCQLKFLQIFYDCLMIVFRIKKLTCHCEILVIKEKIFKIPFPKSFIIPVSKMTK